MLLRSSRATGMRPAYTIGSIIPGFTSLCPACAGASPFAKASGDESAGEIGRYTTPRDALFVSP